jgi:ABC-type antimicrobial peptide transport system permease subunit
MLRWLVDLKIAYADLRATRVRTALTILGIMIGVSSVTAVLAMGEGAKNMVAGQIRDLGDTVITVRPGKVVFDAAGSLFTSGVLPTFSASTITERDLDTVKHTPGVVGAAPFMFVAGSIKSSKPVNGTIIATNSDAEQTLGLGMRAGQFLNEQTAEETVVLGQDLALELFGSETAIGQTVKLRGQDYIVVGILNRFASSIAVSNIIDLNRAAFVPLNAGKAFNQGIAQIQQITVRTADSSQTNNVAGQINTSLLANHTGEEDFTVLRPEQALQLTDQLFKTVALFISAVASISILVGGVGIMNIMLVSVTERTREIGIRKAVGATNQQVLSQFMIESLLMTLVGGVVGILFGYILAFFAGTFLGFMPGFSWWIIALAMSISLSVGVLFGAWPAIKAARKDPIDALRYFQ